MILNTLLSALGMGRGKGSGAQGGLCPVTLPGHLGVWVSAANGVEVFRVVLRAASPDRKTPAPEISYTFAPAFDKPFVQALELPLEWKQFLVGSDHARTGFVTIDFFLSGTATLKASYTLPETVRFYRGKGHEAPGICQVAPGGVERGGIEKDQPTISSLPHAQLKAHSETVKKQLAEKRRMEEEARKAREAELAAAAAKAAEEAKAKAAAAAAKGGAEGAAASPNAPVVIDKSKPTISGGKAAIFYGSSTGNTADVAKGLKAELGASAAHCKSVAEISPLDLAVCDTLILGVPTWHIGEMQDDWAIFLPEVDKVDLKGKKVAIFGLGDGKGYPDTYVDAMDELWQKFKSRGATLHGLWPTEGYEFSKSKALQGGKFLGLVIDVENQHDQTDRRVKEWAQQLKSELGL